MNCSRLTSMFAQANLIYHHHHTYGDNHGQENANKNHCESSVGFCVNSQSF